MPHSVTQLYDTVILQTITSALSHEIGADVVEYHIPGLTKLRFWNSLHLNDNVSQKENNTMTIHAF